MLIAIGTIMVRDDKIPLQAISMTYTDEISMVLMQNGIDSERADQLLYAELDDLIKSSI